MARHEHKLYRNQTVTLDGNEFIGCRFEHCVLQYQGVRPVVLNDNQVSACEWSFKGPAANAVQFLAALHHSGKDGALLVEQTFNMIRGLAPATPDAAQAVQPAGVAQVPARARHEAATPLN